MAWNFARRLGGRRTLQSFAAAAVGLGAIGGGSMAIAEQREKQASAGSKTTSGFSYWTGKTLKDTKGCKVFTGSGNAQLGDEVAQYLGIELGKIKLSRFADGEVSVQVGENVRGKHCVIMQSCSPPNVNDSFLELLLMVSAMRRSSAKTITVVMPYAPYMRSSEKKAPRTPIASKDTMMMLEAMGVDRLICVDMHSGQMQGFLSPSVPSDNITATKIGAIFLSEQLESWIGQQNQTVSRDNVVVVAPHAAAVPRAKEFWGVLLKAGQPDARFAMVLRKPALGEADRKLAKSGAPSLEVHGDEYEVVGDDNVEGGVAIIVNDILDSAESLCDSAAALKRSGAQKVFAFATHALLSPGAIQRIEQSQVDRVLVTNTCPVQTTGTQKIEWMTVAPLLAETIRRVCDKKSLSPLFMLPPSIGKPQHAEDDS